MADGSITFSTALDNGQLEKQLQSLSKRIGSIEDKISQKQAERAPLAEQSKQLAADLDAAKARLEYMKSGQEFFTGAQVKTQTEAIKGMESDWSNVQGRVERYDAAISNATLELERNKEKAGAIAQELAAMNDGASTMAPAIARAEKAMGRFTLRLKQLARRALIFSVITMALRSLRTWMGKVIKTNAEASAAVARLKGALLTLAQPLVNVIIPAFTAFVDVLTRIVSAIASVVSRLFGTTVEKSAEAAKNLYDEQNAIKEVGLTAKKASKYLAGFDEINKLTGDNAGGTGSKADSGIAPDFSLLKDGLSSALTFSLSDILFKWENLTAEDILAKIITGLTTIAGAVIGFMLGGPKGAAIGMMIGTGLGLLISNLIFDGDGKLSGEEILKSVIVVLGALTGGILGFVLGGPGGAAVGIVLGAFIGIDVGSILFNGDGVLSKDEILGTLLVALGAIVGGIIGFSVGGPAGALVGVIIGGGAMLLLHGLMFDADGKANTEFLQTLVGALAIAAGGAIGFLLGGPGGALVGALVGAGATVAIGTLAFGWDGKQALNTILELLNSALFIALGGVIGFAVGGPGGALIGMAIGAGVKLLIDNVSFSDKTSSKKAGYDEGKQIGDNLSDGARDQLGIHSPSTEFKKLGNYTVQGLSDGIIESSPQLQTTLQTVFDGMQQIYNGWQTNFLIGWGEFQALFSGQWTNFWFKIHLSFANQWNSILNTLQAGINSAITALNSLVAAANALAGLTGTHYSSVPLINVGKIPIPALATGAVIPPNREFLAVLGDQKSGTNIEAPLDTIVQAVMLAMAKSNYSGSGQVIENAVYLDGEVIYRNQKKISKRHGVNFTGR